MNENHDERGRFSSSPGGSRAEKLANHARKYAQTNTGFGSSSKEAAIRHAERHDRVKKLLLKTEMALAAELGNAAYDAGLSRAAGGDYNNIAAAQRNVQRQGGELKVSERMTRLDRIASTLRNSLILRANTRHVDTEKYKDLSRPVVRSRGVKPRTGRNF